MRKGHRGGRREKQKKKGINYFIYIEMLQMILYLSRLFFDFFCASFSIISEKINYVNNVSHKIFIVFLLLPFTGSFTIADFAVVDNAIG